MVEIKIDKNNLLPMYTQISERIMDMIQNGELKGGSTLPSAVNLSKKLGRH